MDLAGGRVIYSVQFRRIFFTIAAHRIVTLIITLQFTSIKIRWNISTFIIFMLLIVRINWLMRIETEGPEFRIFPTRRILFSLYLFGFIYIFINLGILINIFYNLYNILFFNFSIYLLWFNHFQKRECAWNKKSPI